MSNPSVSSEPTSNSGQGSGFDTLIGAGTSMASEQIPFGQKRGAKVPDTINPKDLKKMMSLTSSTMKGFKSVMWLHKARTYLLVGTVVSLFVLIGYFVFKHMFYRRVRIAQLTYLVRLDPVNREFSETVANALFVLLRNKHAADKHLPTYDSRIRANGLFYQDLSGTTSAISQIHSILGGVKNMDAYDYNDTSEQNALRADDHLSQLIAVVNKRFVWSRSQKLGTTEQCNALFEQLQKLVERRGDFEAFVENRSMLNFVDREHLNDPEANETLADYAPFLDPPLQTRYERIAEGYDNPEAKAKLEAFLKARPELSNVSAPDLKGRLDDMFAQLRRGLYNNLPGASAEDMDNYHRYLENKEQSPDSCARDYANSRYETLDPALQEAYDSVGELHKVYEALEQRRYNDLFGPMYHAMESFMYTSRVTVNGETKQVFTPENIEEGMRLYQTFLDELYTRMNMESIDLAVDLTLHLMLDPDPRKEEKLDNLGESYVAIVNALMYLERNLQRLLDYNRSRHPDPKYAMKMYKERLKTQFDFHFGYMIQDQWMQFLSMKEPKAYKFTIHWIRRWMSIRRLIKMFEPFEEPPEEEDVIEEETENAIENYIDYQGDEPPLVEGIFKKKSFKKFGKGIKKGVEKGVKSVGKAAKKAAGGILGPIIGPIKDIAKGVTSIPKFFQKFFDMFSNLFKFVVTIFKFLITVITNPFKLVEFFARLLIVVALLPIVIMYNIPIGGLKLMELFIYPFVLLYFTCWNVVLYVVFVALTVVFGMGLDVAICRGRLYPLFYRYFIAVENSPSAWYEVGGYQSKNRNDRIVLAFRECGDNYVPDPNSAKLTCVRKMEGEPKFCPQANIYRVYKNLGMKTPYKPLEFIPDVTFLQMNSSGRRRQIAKYKKMKLRFYEECDEKMRPYDDLTKNICRNVDYLELKNTQKSQIKGLCYDTYCRNGRREQFCHKMTPRALSNTNVPTTFVSRTLFLSGSVTFLACFLVTVLANQR